MMQRIVALGGGHGLYATLSAARRLTPHVTAVVTVADDGGSSGPGQLTSSAEERPGSVSEPCARNAPRQAASASATLPPTTCAGRPRTGRPRMSSRPV